MIWYVIRPPHTARRAMMRGDTVVKEAPSAAQMEAPVVSRWEFERHGLTVRVPVSLRGAAWRGVKVEANTMRALMLAVYLFYFSPIGSPDKMRDVRHDREGFRAEVLRDFAAGRQPLWKDLIGRDYTHEGGGLTSELRQKYREHEGFCEGRVEYRFIHPTTCGTVRLVCSEC